MANENKNDLELNTPKDNNEVDTPITADDLIKRLKMNLRQTEKTEAKAAGEQMSEPVADEPAASEADAEEAVDDGYMAIPAELFDVSEEAEQKPAKKAEQSEKGTSVTASVKKLIASLMSNDKKEEPAEEQSEEVYDEVAKEAEPEEREWKAVNAEDLSFDVPEETDVDTVKEDEAESNDENDGYAETRGQEKEYSVVIENNSDKTNVYDPLMLKQQKKSDDVDNLFEENDQPAVVEAEQLSFSMTEDDIQKSIEEAEAFIFEREYIDNPEEVINGVGPMGEEKMLGDGEQTSENIDQTDLWIASAFGDENEIKDVYGEEKAQEIQTQLDIDVQGYLEQQKNVVNTVNLDEEYVSTSQKKEIFARYRKAHKLGFIKMIASFVLLFIAFIYENLTTFGGTLPGALNQENYPVIYILISLQILVLVSSLAWKPLYNGIRSLFMLRPIPESIASVAVAASAVYHIAHCFISETDPSVSLYVFPAVLCVCALLVYDFLNLKREIFSFNIIASKKIKYTINHVDTEGAKLENEVFGDYLSEEENVSIFKIGKTNFVKGFLERMNAYPRSYGIINILLSAAIASGLIFFIIATVIYDAKTAFSFGYLAFMFAIPACSFISYALPFFRASKKAFDDDSAIIGRASLDEYASANTLSFDDKDVFPSYGVKVKSIKVYGDSRIDKILYNAASVFRIIGGPLADVFETATHDLEYDDENTEIIEIAKDGVEAIIGGQHVYLGKTSYIRSKDFSPINDGDDDALENSGEVSVMYMICDDEISAKMYVQYTIDPDFEFTLRKLYKAGICIGIKTLDPNIDDKLLGSKVKITRYPVRILRYSSVEEASTVQEESDSGIVSKGSPRSLLSAFVLCSKVLYANRTNVTAKILSIAFSILIMAFLLVFGEITAIPSLYVVLYQLFWMIPVYLISKFYV